MSFTGIYGPMLCRGRSTRSPRITDPERWEELKEKHEFPFEETALTGTYQEGGEYPRVEWDTIRGFQTFDYDNWDQKYNISGVAIRYGFDDFCAFWNTVGEVCEDFYFVHSGQDGGWPGAGRHTFYGEHAGDDIDDSIGAVYEVRVTDGSIAKILKSEVTASPWEERDA